MTDYSKLITVNYSGGAGGEFFCFLLDSALKDEPFSAISDTNNKYLYPSYMKPVGDIRYFRSPFLLFALHKDPEYRKLFELAYDATSKTIDNHEMYSDMYNLYLYVKGRTDSRVKQNIVDVYRQFITPPDDYKIDFFYNIKLYTPGLTLADLFPNSKNILLTSTDLKYIKLFWFLSWFKNKPNFSGYLRDIQMYYTNVTSDPTPLNETSIFMDKLMFSNDLETYVGEVNLKLTTLLDKPINLDIDAIRDYRANNQKIIRDFFSLSADEDILSDSVVDKVNNFMLIEAFK